MRENCQARENNRTCPKFGILPDVCVVSQLVPNEGRTQENANRHFTHGLANGNPGMAAGDQQPAPGSSGGGQAMAGPVPESWLGRALPGAHTSSCSRWGRPTT